MKKIIFTGPESSGKSTLAKKAQAIFGGELVLEYAREYLNNLDRKYTQHDLLLIAKKQVETQDKAILSGSKLVFLDTDLLTLKIWSEYKYGSCDSWIINKLKTQKDFIYILCKPDFDWEKDDLRENPNDQDELYNIYIKELENYGFYYIEVEDSVEKRIEKLKKIVT